MNIIKYSFFSNFKTLYHEDEALADPCLYKFFWLEITSYNLYTYLIKTPYIYKYQVSDRSNFYKLITQVI